MQSFGNMHALVTVKVPNFVQMGLISNRSTITLGAFFNF